MRELHRGSCLTPTSRDSGTSGARHRERVVPQAVPSAPSGELGGIHRLVWENITATGGSIPRVEGFGCMLCSAWVENSARGRPYLPLVGGRVPRALGMGRILHHAPPLAPSWRHTGVDPHKPSLGATIVRRWGGKLQRGPSLSPTRRGLVVTDDGHGKRVSPRIARIPRLEQLGGGGGGNRR